MAPKSKGKIKRTAAVVAACLPGLFFSYCAVASDTASPNASVAALTEDVIAAVQSSSDELDSALLFVGPGSVDSDSAGTWVSVLGQVASVSVETTFPRGLVARGDYIAVTGAISSDGTAQATSVIRLGGQYSPGNSPVYIRGLVSALDASGMAAINGATVDLAQAYAGPDMTGLQISNTVEILGFESDSIGPAPFVVATSASNLSGITGSGLRGITGSGLRGITGSGLRGITGSGLRGITGSGLRGITGSGLRGITGSGLRGITGSGLRGITGSGLRGITGSGLRGITGSGLRGITGSGLRGITGSGLRGITGSGLRGITGSGLRGITGSGLRGITGSGLRGITGSGLRSEDLSGGL